MSKYEWILFDLDGTLTDPKKGITFSVAYALDKMGIKDVDPETLTKFIGPPLKASFKDYYHMTDDEADLAIEYYRERFKGTGIYENLLYEGIFDLLEVLKAQNKKLAVATSKPTVFAIEILKFFQIDHFFDVIVGSELDGSRSEKSEVIAHVLRSFEGIVKNETVMVGDRMYDIEGAKKHQIASIGVLYGYGSLEELKGQGADLIVDGVSQLKDHLLKA